MNAYVRTMVCAGTALIFSAAHVATCAAQSAGASATNVTGKADVAPGPRPMVVKYRLLSHTDVQQDLKLTGAQNAKIEALTQEILQSRQTMSEEAASAREAQIGEEKMALLTAAQRVRLDQIVLWMLGNPVDDPDVRSQLQLTEQQQAALQNNDKALEAARKKLIAEGVDRPRLLALRDASIKKAEALLTASQLQQLRRIAGQPFVETAMDGGICFQMPPGTGGDKPAPLKQLEAGKPMPDFVALNHDGKEVRLSDYRGKVVVIDLWATWCGPCIQSLPDLETLHRQMKDQGVVVLALNVGDGKPAYEAWVKKNPKYTVPFLYDPAGADKPGIRAQYGVMGIPTTFVVGRDGKLVGKTMGSNRSAMASGGNAPGWDGTLGEIDARLAELLKSAGVHLTSPGGAEASASSAGF